jgi:antitoxin component YwqK of YwqJK toxin-antitoxin module
MLAAAKLLFTGFIFLRICCANAQQTSMDIDKAGVNPSTPIENFPGLYKALPFDLPQSGNLIAENGDQRLLFKVTVRKGKLNGAWQSWFPDGVVCDSGRLVNNIPDGKWVFRNAANEIIAVRQYSAEKFIRITNEMQHYHPKRSFYYLASLYQQNRSKALHFLDAAYSFPVNGGKRKIATLRQLAEENTASIQPYHPVFVQCLHEGVYINYFSGGLVRDSGSYKDGIRNGKWIHRDTATAGRHQGAYHNGIRVKEWKVFDESGRLNEIIQYDRTGRISWRKKINRQSAR